MNESVLILIHSMSMGGAERVAANLANYWVRKGTRVCLATLTTEESDFYILDSRVQRVALGVAKPSRNSANALVNNLMALVAVRRLLKSQRPNVAIAMMTTCNVYLAIAGMGILLRKIGSEHSHPPERSIGKSWEILRKICYRQLHTVTALTKSSARWIRENTTARHVAVIPNPIPWPLDHQPPLILPSEVLQSGRRRLLAVGRLTYEKGFDVLISVFSQVAAANKDWDLIILGRGPMQNQLEDLVVDLELQGRVFLLGEAGNIGEWYESADAYVMSSRFEGFGNTLAEAMAYGLPAVSFDCETGPREIIRHEVDGLLVPAGDVKGLAEALKKLMTDGDMRQRFSRRAVEVRERFSPEKIADQWEKLF